MDSSSTMGSIPALVTTEWLNNEMKCPEWKNKYKLLDATWDLSRSKRNFQEEHKTCRIPGAKYFALADCRDKNATLPNTVPTLKHFEDYVNSFGISKDHHIILYDNSEKYGLFSAPRVWWLFNLFGHNSVSIVDGGLPKWKQDGLPTSSGEYSENEEITEDLTSKFIAVYNPELIKDLSFMKSNLESGTPVQVIDARSNGRFRGVEPEPRDNVPSGHILDSLSVPFIIHLHNDRKILLSVEKIEENYKKYDVDLDKPIVATCGSAITACILAFTIFLVNGTRIPVFDDSWFGWQANTPNNLQVREI